MKYQVSAIAPLKAAQVLGMVFFIATLPLLLIAVVAYDLALPQGPAYLVWVFLMVPLVNALFAFFFGCVFAICYNLAAKRIGGFELTLQEKS